MRESIDSLMSGFPPLENDQVKASAWRTPRHARWSFSHLRQLLPTAPIAASKNPAKLTSARQDLSDLAFSDRANQQYDVQQNARMNGSIINLLSPLELALFLSSSPPKTSFRPTTTP